MKRKGDSMPTEQNLDRQQEQAFISFITANDPTPENVRTALMQYAEHLGFVRTQAKPAAAHAYHIALRYLREGDSSGFSLMDLRDFALSLRVDLLNFSFTRGLDGEAKARATTFLQTMHNTISPVPSA